MKTETTNPMTEVSNIINPCRILKIDDFMRISNIQTGNEHSSYFQVVHLLSRFESLTSQPLVKEMFVFEVEKPLEDKMRLWDYKSEREINEAKSAYQAAQEKVWFDGFERRNMFSVEKRTDAGVLIIHEGNIGFSLSIAEDWTTHQIKDPTVFDLLYHITKYNETAQSKININYSQNFIKELLK